MQEIIDAANIGRSTFYAHFETKDALLRAVCTELFAHIVSEEPLREATHDFSHGAYGLAERLAHILYHIRDRRQDLCGLLRGDGLFLRYFCEYLTGLFAEYLPARAAVPRDFLLDQLTGGFAGAARWWMRTGMAQQPEQVAAYFLACAAPLQSRRTGRRRAAHSGRSAPAPSTAALPRPAPAQAPAPARRAG